MPRRLAIGTLIIAIFAVGVAVGAFVFERTKTQVVVETQTVTERSVPDGMTLRVQIIDYTPVEAGASSDAVFPFGSCAINARFPEVSRVTVHEPGSPGADPGDLLGLTDQSTATYFDLGEPFGCVMEFEIPDLVASRFYLIHADSDTRIFEGGYNWLVSAAELERKGWRVRLELR